ncbi:cytochrome c [Lacibacter luteus]|uniref:Cytochrome c n=1 Tax=Lacibacter luteus TaxID=2508719 RepID=A0A4Q1CLR0_9BACT|nr:cytochrome c [Lacibacter luteus]RXK61694.1 cytochrome c [Lacibacter luteus]
MKRIFFLIPVASIVLIGMTTQQIDKKVMDRGKKVYSQYCSPCHQADGSGVPGLNPPLEKTTHVLGNKSSLIKIILKGLNTHEEINGETYNNVMAPHNHLTDQQISDVLTYVRNSFGNKASLITVAEVKSVRAKTK